MSSEREPRSDTRTDEQVLQVQAPPAAPVLGPVLGPGATVIDGAHLNEPTQMVRLDRSTEQPASRSECIRPQQNSPSSHPAFKIPGMAWSSIRAEGMPLHPPSDMWVMQKPTLSLVIKKEPKDE